MKLLLCAYFQVQQKLTDLQEEERSVTAQLSWKRALEDSSPVMVNGTAGLNSELHQGDLFSQDPFQDDQPKELREDEAAAGICAEPKEHPDQKETEDDEQEVEEEEAEEEKVPEGSKTAEEAKPKPDALDDLFSSLASSDMYNSVSVFSKPQENVEKVGSKLSSSPYSAA